MRYLKRLIVLPLIVFSMLLITRCSNTEIDEKNLESCVSLLHNNGTTTLNGEIFTGSCIVFDSEGVMRSMLSFKNGKPGGIHRGYYPDGSLEYEGNRKNGEIHGKYIKYYFGGQTEMTGQFKRGIYNGKWKYYDVNGNLSMEKKYIRGSLIDSIIY